MATGGMRAKGTLLATTAKGQLGSDIILPSLCKEIVNFTPYIIPVTFTADLIMDVLFNVESDSADLKPTQFGLLGSSAENGTITTAANAMLLQSYDMFAKVDAGDVVKIYGTNIDDPTTDPYAGANIMISDRPSGRKQIHWICPTSTSAYGTGNDAFVAGSTYRFNGVQRIVNTYGWLATTTATISDSIGGNYRLTSNDFKTKFDQIYAYQVGFVNVVAASSEQIPKIQLWNVDIPCNTVVSITEEFATEGVTIAGNAKFLSGVGYEKVGGR